VEIRDRRALVLGGTSGIGLATVVALEAAGANVVAASRSAENREAAAAQVGDAVAFRQVDVLDREALGRLFEELGSFDILVSAATGGARAGGPFLEMDLDAFQGSFRKLWGYTNAVRLGAPQLADDGTIVLVSGFPARRCPPGGSAISTVGNAVEGFVRAIAPEIAPRRINVVSPGIIDTPMLTLPPEDRDAILANMTRAQPIPRPGRADEVADAILFAIRNDFVTGSTIDVEGGALLA
jgi:NAD(P)-dependent dehydrogenase (short-subunit alcohol dehydrogenase family)